jgi:hypothetical protein
MEFGHRRQVWLRGTLWNFPVYPDVRNSEFGTDSWDLIDTVPMAHVSSMWKVSSTSTWNETVVGHRMIGEEDIG